MDPVETYGRDVLDAAERAGVCVIIAHLVPPRVVYANGAAAALLGVSVDALYACGPLDFIAPEQRAIVAERLRRRVAGEELPAPEVTIQRGDGSRVVVECRIVDLVLEARPAMAIFLTAPSVQRVADLAADARYRALIDAAPDGVAVTSGPRFLYANQRALSLIGCPSLADLGTYSLTEHLSAEDLRVMAERTEVMLRTGERFPPRDYVVRGPEGDTVVEVSSMPIDFEGAPAVLAFLRDVTERRRMQFELERAQRLSALGTLLAGVTHEVNNPLLFASLGAEVLERYFDDMGGGDRDSARAALSDVVSGLDRIASLVRELRSFVRPEETGRVAIDVGEALASALRMTAPTVRPRATLDVQLGPLPPVACSPGRLEQVFVNLLINAAQSFPREDPSSNVVSVRASGGAGEVTITFEDNGGGISPRDQARVFDPFFTTKAVGEGTGLGLSICHAIVSQHGGRIDISSVEGKGTKVTVVLPTDGRVDAPPVQPPPSVAPRRSRILVIDDEPAIGRLLRTILSPAHEVTVTCGGAEARELLTRDGSAFDLVLCDLTMPEVSGVDLFELVRARSPGLADRFVLMSGGLFPEDALARVGGANAPRLEKPFVVDDVHALIERLAGKTSG